MSEGRAADTGVGSDSAMGGTRAPERSGVQERTDAPRSPQAGGGGGGERSAAWAVALVIGGGISVQCGGALAVWLMPRTGPAGVVTLRLVITGLVLLAVCRPRVRGYTRADWGTVLAFGIVTAAMNHIFYQAVARIPLGIAVTLEVLGPMALSVLAARRLVSVLWAALAVAGVFLLGGGGCHGLNVTGVLCALAAGATWAVYIVLNARTGRRFPQADGLALAMAAGALLSLPLGIAAAGARMAVPSTVGIGAVVAMLSSVIPYTFELIALRRLHAAKFAVLMSLEPATAALAGFVVLHQALSLVDVLGIGLVIAASMGAVRTRVGVRRPAAS